MWRCSLWALLPPLYSAFTAAGLWMVYFLALREGFIVPLGAKYKRQNGSQYPPFISVTGNFPPTSCIFSEVMNLSAFVGLVLAVLRYLQVKDKMDKQWLNVSCLAAFCVACFGMTLVGNFQVFTEETIHNFGTFLTFGLGAAFCWVQSYITLRVNLHNEGKKAAIVRFLLSGSITVCIVIHISMLGLRLYMPAAQSQWALVMLFLTFLSTFAIEFRHSHFEITCTDSPRPPLFCSRSIKWSSESDDRVALHKSDSIHVKAS